MRIINILETVNKLFDIDSNLSEHLFDLILSFTINTSTIEPSPAINRAMYYFCRFAPSLNISNLISDKIVKMYQKFNTSHYFLSNKIFIPQPPQQGQVWTNLNITILPDYLAYIKQQLTKQEQILVSDYHLQTYLLQTALKPHPANSFDTCTNQIIAHIRSRPQFWVKKTGSEQESLKMHQAIQEYHKDCQFLKQSFLSQDNKYKQQQIPYKINENRKIIQDYRYDGNPYTKGMYRFSASVYPWISGYVIQKIKPQISPELRQQLSNFIFEFTVHLAIVSKPKQRPSYYSSYSSFPYQYSTINSNTASTDKKFALEIQAQLKNFSVYLQSKDKNIDTKYYSNSKDYCIIGNSIIIAQKYIDKYYNEQPSNQQINESDLQKSAMSGQANIQQIPIKQNVQCKQIKEDIIPKTNHINHGQYCKIQPILQDLVNRFVTQPEVILITDWLFTGQYNKIKQLSLIRQNCQRESITSWLGLISDVKEIDAAFQKYNQIMDHPENTNRMKYRLQGSQVGWSQQQYQLFLECFLKFFNVPTNNKKIALAMGKDIEPNHVKHVKGLYMRNMNQRIDQGEIGGGKKGVFESKIEFLKKDIQTFNMKWFKKEKKSKTKKIKRRRKRQTFDEQEHDSDY